MKKLIQILVLICMALPVIAQEDAAEEALTRDPKAKAKLRAAHAAYITERLGLTAEEAEKFWPIYREFAQKRENLKQQLKEYKQAGKNDKEMLDLDLKIRQQELDLEKDYAGRFQKVITPQKVRHLRQAEGDFRKLVFRQIQQRQQRREQLRDRSQQQHLQHRNN